MIIGYKKRLYAIFLAGIVLAFGFCSLSAEASEFTDNEKSDVNDNISWTHDYNYDHDHAVSLFSENSTVFNEIRNWVLSDEMNQYVTQVNAVDTRWSATSADKYDGSKIFNAFNTVFSTIGIQEIQALNEDFHFNIYNKPQSIVVFTFQFGIAVSPENSESGALLQGNMKTIEWVYNGSDEYGDYRYINDYVEYLGDGWHLTMCGYDKSVVTMDGVLSASKKEIIVDEDSADVIFYFKTMADSDQFMLYENDVPVDCFADSGNYEQDGDDIKGDGVYSLKITVDVTGDNAKPTDNSKVVYNTYNVRYGDEIVSDEVTIDLITPFTDKELIDMSSVDNAIDELMKSDEFKAMNQQEKIDSLMALLTNLSEKKLVNSIVLNEDRIEFLYSSEASGMILFTSFDEKNDSITTTVTETSTTTITTTVTTETDTEQTTVATTDTGDSVTTETSTVPPTTTVGTETTLPQTGYSKWYQALIAAAMGMIGVGLTAIVKSGIFRKKENNS